jgi:hypothetical protein
LPQCLPRIDAEFVGQPLPRLRVRLQRVGLPVTPIQGRHQLAAEAFAGRVRADQLTQLGHLLRMAAERERDIDALLHGQ